MIDSVHGHDEVARRIFQVVQKHVLVKMDNKTMNTSISDLSVDSLAMILLSNELRKEICNLRELITEKLLSTQFRNSVTFSLVLSHFLLKMFILAPQQLNNSL